MPKLNKIYPSQNISSWADYKPEIPMSTTESLPKPAKSHPKKSSIRDQKEIREDLTALIQESGIRLYFEVLREHIQLKKSDFEQVVNEIDNFEKVLNTTAVLGKTPVSVEDSFRDPTRATPQEPESRVKIETSSPKSLKKRKDGGMKREAPFAFDKKKSVLAKRDICEQEDSADATETNTSDLIKKVIFTLIGEQPKKAWLANWNRMDRQIFWLIMSKIWSFSSDWQAELNYSSDFPRSKGKILLGANPQFAFYEKKVVREMLNQIYFDYQQQMTMTRGLSVSQMPENCDFLFEEIGCDEKLEEYVRRILETYVSFTEKDERKEIQLNRLIKMQEVNAVLQILSLQPNMIKHFDLTTKKYIKNRNYSNEQMVIVIQRIASAIKKLRELITMGKFPMQGIRLNLDQINVMKQIHIFKPVLFWDLCFKRILHKLTSSSMDI